MLYRRSSLFYDIPVIMLMDLYMINFGNMDYCTHACTESVQDGKATDTVNQHSLENQHKASI